MCGPSAGHSRLNTLKRPPMASLAAHMRCAKVGRNDTIPNRSFWCNIHTYLQITDTAEARAGRIAREQRRQDSAAALSCAVTLRVTYQDDIPQSLHLKLKTSYTASGDEGHTLNCGTHTCV